MRSISMRFTIVFAVIIVLSGTSSAQIEDQVSAYTGKNASGYLQPLADAFGADLNDGLFHSAYVPPTGFHFSLELRIMSVIFGDGDRSFLATTEGTFSPEIQVLAPTVVGSGEAKIVIGDGGTSFAFPGGFNLNSFALAVPQLRIGTFAGTEALIRYFAVNTGDIELGNISLFGFGLRHNISQYFPHFPFDIAAGFFYQTFSIGNDLLSSSALSIGAQVGKRLGSGLTILEPYAGLSLDKFDMDVSYESKAGGAPIDINLNFETVSTAHLTLGLALRLPVINIHGEYNIAAQRSFSLGLAVGY